MPLSSETFSRSAPLACQPALCWLLLCLCVASGQARAEDQAVPVTTIVAEAGDVTERLPVTGSITAAHFAELSPAVAGLVASLAVDVGSRVKKGDPLLSLDKEISALLLEGANARAQQAAAQLDDVQRQLQEATSLEAGQSIAASRVRSLRSEAEMARAALTSARAEARRAEAELARHTVKAPFAGVISARHVDVGEWVAPGDALLTLVDTTQVYADFAIAQQYLKDVSEQSELILRLDSQPDQPLEATVSAIVPVSDPTARTFLLRATLPASPLVAPGMSVRGHLTLASEQGQLALPRDALIRYPDGRVTVWRVDKSGEQPVAQERSIRIREGYGERVVVTDGISAGDEVVVRGNEGLREGVPLKLQDE